MIWLILKTVELFKLLLGQNMNKPLVVNLGFLWTSWDYGLITKLKTKGEYVYDYMEVIATMRKNDITKITSDYRNHNLYYNYEWGYLPRYVNVPPSIERLQTELFQLLGGYNKNNHIQFFGKQLDNFRSILRLID